MRALTIRQPWAQFIVAGPKRIENREWRAVPWKMLGQTFLIHAAKGCTAEEYEDAYGCAQVIMHKPGAWLGDRNVIPLKRLARGALIGRARLAGVIYYDKAGCETTAAQTVGELDALHAYFKSPWYTGAIGLVLADVQALAEPVPCKGALGFFEVPDALLVGARWVAAPGGVAAELSEMPAAKEGT